MSSEVADVLDRAAEVIETQGWTQGSLYPKGRKGPCCALGALTVVFGTEHPVAWMIDEDGVGYETNSALRREIGGQYVSDWNDDPNRTADEVITALRNAAAAERDAS